MKDSKSQSSQNIPSRILQGEYPIKSRRIHPVGIIEVFLHFTSRDKQHAFFSFIIEQYQLKNNDWIIASTKSSELDKDNLCLIPLEELPKYFEVSASLRRKKSGTSSLAQSMRDRAEEIISKLFDNYEIKIEDNKTFLYGDIGIQPKELPENLYLSSKGNNIYFIRKRSTTNNANIMFSLKLKENHSFKSEEFLHFLNNKA